MSLDDTLKPRARYMVMVDHFAATDDGKAMLMGVFDRVSIRRKEGAPLRLSRGFLAMQFECSVAAGPVHTLEVALVDDQGRDVSRTPAQQIEFTLAGEGLGLRMGMVMQIAAVDFPRGGIYEWCATIDGSPIGTCPLIVIDLGDGP